MPAEKLALAGVVACLSYILFEAHQEGNEPLKNNKSSKDCAYAPSAHLLTKANVTSLEKDSYVVIDNVLTPAQLSSISLEIQQLSSRFSASPNNDLETRTDTMFFLTTVDRDEAKKREGDANGEALLHSQDLLRGVAHELSKLNFRGFNPTNCTKQIVLGVPDQVQLSIYAKENHGFYKAHRDGVAMDFWQLGLLHWLRQKCYRQRVVTCILYLSPRDDVNGESWSEQDGGCLRLHLGAKSHDQTGATSRGRRDIQPVGGRLLLFDSQVVLHEVMATNRQRVAITIWLTCNDETQR